MILFECEWCEVRIALHCEGYRPHGWMTRASVLPTYDVHFCCSECETMYMGQFKKPQKTGNRQRVVLTPMNVTGEETK